MNIIAKLDFVLALGLHNFFRNEYKRNVYRGLYISDDTYDPP